MVILTIGFEKFYVNVGAKLDHKHQVLSGRGQGDILRCYIDFRGSDDLV